MAAETMYGKQFESLMADVCQKFGAKLLRSWDTSANKEYVTSFVEEAVVNFFKMTKPEPDVMEPVPSKKKRVTKGKGKAVITAVDSPVGLDDTDVVDHVPSKKKRVTKGKGKAGIARKVPEPEPDEAEITVEPSKKGKAAKGKPMCQATTAKGTPCSKCAIDGGPFCTVHMKTHKTKSPVKENEKEEDVVHDIEIEESSPYKVVVEDDEYVMSDNEEVDPTYKLAEEDFDDD